mmetsp:Transcript_24871/g.41197  ORF Transcript_24871/g.41197 Transcript_24871/m.41197 type:complete len:314 (-) Transcript_24871:137-1078(-)|eukprot:CAMPEP_0119007776 /NCGR_PEP_ID=MMETSP1176-20130426/3240_1 /TAXON_ID=265551 /ORGANISM="Synedropsis recta cf, Strain CCMP1620" /LENGTH=313 /DNA_ID=CAMNT_0006959991 /DNA_START=32 /DNA_END=973 /DNA_ORIENTATION=-
MELPLPTSLFGASSSHSCPQRGRIVSNLMCLDSSDDDSSSNVARSTSSSSSSSTVASSMEGATATDAATTMHTTMHNNNINTNTLSTVDTVQDLTASILDRVSHITISADSWTMESSSPEVVAEVSFTEEESPDPESPPFVPCSLLSLSSPLRAVKSKRRLTPPTPLFCRNNNNNNMLPPYYHHANKKRRHAAPPLPSSPIVDSLTARIAPIFSPFFRYDARLDRLARTQSSTTDEDNDFCDPPACSTSTSTSAIVNPFAQEPSTWVMTTPTPSARRRRRRLRMKKTMPFPSFPCLSTTTNLHCSPISTPPYL